VVYYKFFIRQPVTANDKQKTEYTENNKAIKTTETTCYTMML